MDPLTQGVLGAAAAQAVVGERLGRKTWWLGALGGMAPDLDVLIRSASDPLLALELHRHFTHSLAFIPVGGLLVAAPFLWKAREQPREHQLLIIAATTLGWATHGLLDAFTSYGTMLFWPFSRERVAWNWISVIDPVYTVILAIAVVMAAKRLKAWPAWAGLLASSLYLGLCGFQHARALAAQKNIAELRNHTIVRGTAQPLLLTNLLWRSLYEADDGRLWIDALTIPWWAKIEHHGSGTRRVVEAPSEPDGERERDLARFAWFASDWIYAAPELQPEGSTDEIYCDARYSLDPARFDALFCVALGPDGATQLLQRRPEDPKAMLGEMLKMLRPPTEQP
ncbi:MAG TPA: metal-dependent hydrolase [Enhygromyxa sp.]|nr:metal-dependent hydrolase [Enhygromyxa sp.]